MNQINKISFLSLLAVIFFLPVFFIPSMLVPLEIAKASLLVVGVVIIFLLFLVAVVKRRSVSIPREYLLWSVIILPLVYLVSGLLSSVPQLSLFGYGFEVGTFGLVFFVCMLFGLIAVLLVDSSQVLRALSAMYLSLSGLALFALVKLISGGDFPVWKVFSGKLGSPVGGWTDYAVVFGFLAIVSALALGMLKLRKSVYIFLSSIFFLATALLVIANFSTALLFTFALSVVLVIYLITVEENFSHAVGSEGEDTPEPRQRKVALWPAVVLGVVSLVFVINPMISDTQSLREKVSVAFSVSNNDVKPTFLTTVDVSKRVLSSNPFLGAGPNTFSQSWLLHKPKALNTTPFWNTNFPSGIGFMPTQVASVGLVGSLAWLFFLVSFLLLGVKALSRLSKDLWQRFALVSSFFGALFLWAINFLYTPSVTMLALAFVMTAIFIAACRTAGVIAVREIVFSRNVALNFGSALVIVALGIGTVTTGYHMLSRTASVFYFQKARAMASTPGTSVGAIEAKLNKAISLVPQDIYYTTLSDLNLSYAQSLVGSLEPGGESASKEMFQSALQKAISSAQSAVDANPTSYSNWIKLGQIYSSLAPVPFSMEGARQSALTAFEEARKRNPNTPEVPLLISVLDLGADDRVAARRHIEESLLLKNDYADAYYLLAQLEIKENNIIRAIRSVETSAVLAANNSGLFFQLGLLRYENKDYLEAIRALSKALEITPNYANARYFLGLSLHKLGRQDEAIGAFEDLVRTNPDNQEVQKILMNLKEGKEPLLGIGPDATADETPQTPPISDQ